MAVFPERLSTGTPTLFGWRIAAFGGLHMGAFHGNGKTRSSKSCPVSSNGTNESAQEIHPDSQLDSIEFSASRGCQPSKILNHLDTAFPRHFHSTGVVKAMTLPFEMFDQHRET